MWKEKKLLVGTDWCLVHFEKSAASQLRQSWEPLTSRATLWHYFNELPFLCSWVTLIPFLWTQCVLTVVRSSRQMSSIKRVSWRTWLVHWLDYSHVECKLKLLLQQEMFVGCRLQGPHIWSNFVACDGGKSPGDFVAWNSGVSISKFPVSSNITHIGNLLHVIYCKQWKLLHVC